MPKDIDPHGTTKQNNRWNVIRNGNKKTETAQSRQEKILEKAREIAKKKKGDEGKG